MSISTKTGDKGITSLYGGKNILKSDLQVEAYGTIDELTSFAGLVISKLKNTKEKNFLIKIQKDLYVIMSHLSGKNINLDCLGESIKNLEEKINYFEKKLPKINKFIIPSGTEISSWFHILRTVCRRAERSVVRFFTNSQTIKQSDNQIILRYLNRLSDFFFILARFYNRHHETVIEI